MSPEQLFKKHCKSNATFKQYETFCLGYRLGVDSNATIVTTYNTPAPTSEEVKNAIKEAGLRYDNAAAAYAKIAENYKIAESKKDDAIAFLALVYNSLPEGAELKDQISAFLTAE